MSDDRYLRHDGPMHEWFELSYASYLTVPRSLIQEMPVEWQERLRRCLEEMEETFTRWPLEGAPEVRLRDLRGRFVRDPLRDYRHPDDDAIESIRKRA